VVVFFRRSAIFELSTSGAYSPLKPLIVSSNFCVEALFLACQTVPVTPLSMSGSTSEYSSVTVVVSVPASVVVSVAVAVAVAVISWVVVSVSVGVDPPPDSWTPRHPAIAAAPPRPAICRSSFLRSMSM
jgi:hypothetical protein